MSSSDSVLRQKPTTPAVGILSSPYTDPGGHGWLEQDRDNATSEPPSHGLNVSRNYVPSHSFRLGNLPEEITRMVVEAAMLEAFSATTVADRDAWREGLSALRAVNSIFRSSMLQIDTSFFRRWSARQMWGGVPWKEIALTYYHVNRCDLRPGSRKWGKLEQADFHKA